MGNAIFFILIIHRHASNLAQDEMDIAEKEFDEEENTQEEVEEDEEVAPSPCTSTSRPTTPASVKSQKGRRTPKDQVGNGILDYLNRRREEREERRPLEDADILFLPSILLDMREMDRNSKAAFKIKVLQLMDDIQRQTTTPVHHPQSNDANAYSSLFDNLNDNAATNYTQFIVYHQGQSYQQI